MRGELEGPARLETSFVLCVLRYRGLVSCFYHLSPPVRLTAVGPPVSISGTGALVRSPLLSVDAEAGAYRAPPLLLLSSFLVFGTRS